MAGSDMERHTTGAKDRRGASPVIGIILLVAITVILSAVVGAMAVGMGGSVNEQVHAAVDVTCDGANDELGVQLLDERSADHINVTLTSGSAEAVGRLDRTGGRLKIAAGMSATSTGAARVYDGGQWDESGVGGGGGGGGGGVGGGGGGGVGGGGGGGVPMAAAPDTGDTVSVTVVASTGDASTTVVTESCDL